jgi:hypothetical protein
MMTTVRSSLQRKRDPTEHGVDSFRGAQKSSPGVSSRSRNKRAWNDCISSNLGLRDTFEGTFGWSDVDVDVSSMKSW